MRSRTRRTVKTTMLALLIAIGAGSAAAGDPMLELITGDSVPNDNLGAASAISGSVAIVAAPRDDASGTQSGSAYLFDVSTGQELHKLVPDDGVLFDTFGFAVAISGNTAIAGAYKDDDHGGSSGSAYLFDVTTGDQTFKLVPEDGSGGDVFGFAVGISGSVAVIGAPSDDDLGAGAGSAYLFDTTTGLQLFKLTASDGAAGDVFGNCVAIDGNIVIVGAPSKNGAQGAAYLFDATTGLQLDKLSPNNPQSNSWFGREVAVSGTRAIVGAPFADFVVSDRGLAYLFDTNTGNQLFQLMAFDAATFDLFGQGVAISGNQALVGAPDHAAFGGASGAAYLFDVTTGQQTSKLTPNDAAAGERFGESLGLSGDRAVIGAISGWGAAVNTGSAYGFDVSDAVWDNLANGSIWIDGIPSLVGLGDLTPGSDLSLVLGQSEPNSPAVLIFGVSNLSAPAKGGVLVPNPDVIISGFATNADGRLEFPTVFPAGVPSGVPLYMQFWVEDSFGFFPLAASNGITKTTP